MSFFTKFPTPLRRLDRSLRAARASFINVPAHLQKELGGEIYLAISKALAVLELRVIQDKRQRDITAKSFHEVRAMPEWRLQQSERRNLKKQGGAK